VPTLQGKKMIEVAETSKTINMMRYLQNFSPYDASSKHQERKVQYFEHVE